MTAIKGFLSQRYVLVLIVLIIGLGVLIPFASSSPDGLETVADDLGFSEPGLLFRGIFQDYLVSVGNSWLGTLLAGIIGILIIVVFFMGLQYTVAQRNLKLGEEVLDSTL